MTFNYALAYLAEEFGSTYRGAQTVDEMCSTLADRISWEDTPGDKVYHHFETKSGPNTMVADDDVIRLAQSMWGRSVK